VSPARIVAVLFAVLCAARIAAARVTLAPGLTVPAVVPLGVGLVAVLTLAVWLIARRARRFRSCPHPHPVWGAR
jgi:hypothetical protein